MKATKKPYSIDIKNWVDGYYKILTGYALQITILFIAILMVSITSIFSVYSWYFGDLAFAYNTEMENKEKITEFIKEYHSNNNYPQDLKFTREEVDEILFGKEQRLSSHDVLNRLSTSTKDSSINRGDVLLLFRDTSIRKSELKNRVTDDAGLSIILSKNIARRIEGIRDLKNTTTLANIPFIGTSSTLTDFIFLLYLISLGLIFWLRKVIEFIKNILKEIFNFPSLEDTSIEISIPSMFYLIMPSIDNVKFYKYIEHTLMLFVFSLITFVCTNVYDIFIMHSAYNLPLISLPGFNLWQIFWSVGIYAILLSLIIYTIFQIKKHLLDVRNLLILIKWQRTAFFPQIYNLFQSNDLYLKKYQNRMEYRKVGISKEMSLCIYANVYNPYILDDIRFINARVDLANSLKKFFEHNKTEEYKRFFLIDKYVRRILTVEENKMRDYVKSIFCDKHYEDELSKEFEKCISTKTHQIKEVVTKPRLVDEKVLAAIQGLIAEGKTREALSLFDQNVDEKLEEIKDQIIMLIARFERIHGHYLKGIIPIETYEMEINIINNNILEIIKYFR